MTTKRFWVRRTEDGGVQTAFSMADPELDRLFFALGYHATSMGEYILAHNMELEDAKVRNEGKAG